MLHAVFSRTSECGRRVVSLAHTRESSRVGRLNQQQKEWTNPALYFSFHDFYYFSSSTRIIGGFIYPQRPSGHKPWPQGVSPSPPPPPPTIRAVLFTAKRDFRHYYCFVELHRTLPTRAVGLSGYGSKIIEKQKSWVQKHTSRYSTPSATAIKGDILPLTQSQNCYYVIWWHALSRLVLDEYCRSFCQTNHHPRYFSPLGLAWSKISNTPNRRQMQKKNKRNKKNTQGSHHTQTHYNTTTVPHDEKTEIPRDKAPATGLNLLLLLLLWGRSSHPPAAYCSAYMRHLNYRFVVPFR